MQTEKQCRCGVEWFHCISTAQCWQHWACLWVSPSTLGKFPNTSRSSQQCFLDYHDCYVVDLSQMTMHEISVELKMQSTWKLWHQGIYLKLLSAWVGHFSTQGQIFFWKLYSIKKNGVGGFDKLYHWILTSGMWPAEEILTYFCVLHPDVFRYVTKLKLQLWYFLSKHAIMIGWVRFWLSSAAPNINNFVKWTMVTKKVSCEDPEKKKIWVGWRKGWVFILHIWKQLWSLHIFGTWFSCRKKRVIELGAGYGLAGLAIAACTEASEVLLTDGNPQVVDCILLMQVFCWHKFRAFFSIGPLLHTPLIKALWCAWTSWPTC